MKKFDIEQFNACEEAVVWYKDHESFEEAWDKCHRGDWMLWIAQKLDVDLKLLIRAKELCALTVRHLMKDQRSKDACLIALCFSKGLATREELDAAADAAADAAYAAVYAAAARKQNRQKTADICRRVLTEDVFKKIK